VGFTRAELEAFRGGTLPDLVAPGTRLLFAGINPGLLTVAMQAHFAKRGNRFYPALYRAGITDRIIDASAGFRPEDREHLLARGIGITSLVAGASAKADELAPEQLVAGAAALTERVEGIRPTAVAMLGISAYRIAFARKKAVVGLQPDTLGGTPLWVLPNPSGLNAHESIASLAAAYRQVAIAAGVPVFDAPL
jgi:TDG/mug DNA glycosylase family protein